MNANNPSIHLSDDNGCGVEVFVIDGRDDALICLVLEDKPPFKGQRLL